MQRVNITTAKAQLSYLLKELEDYDQEIIIEKAGKPVAKIVKYNGPKNTHRVGALIDKIQISEDFDELPLDLQQAFGIQ